MKRSPLYAALFAAFAVHAAHAEQKKPNILLIVADDLGYGELGAQGFTKDIPTPNIDSIAANGVRFTSGYVSGPYCSPTRAGLLTGRYQQRFGHEFNPGPPAEAGAEVGLSLKETTLGNRLQAQGYATGWFGKSHLGTSEPFHPLNRGFDEFYGFLGGAHSYLDPANGTVNSVLRGKEEVEDPGYLTEAFAREAVDFIGRRKDTPWFVYLPFNAVHSPLETTEKYEARFSGIRDEKRRKFAALLSALDDAVGSVLAKVREQGQEEDTLVVFISDNGGPTEQISSGNGPLRGFKSGTFEGGIRVPFAIQWKGTIPSGKVDSRPVIQLDLLPTALAAAGAEIQPDWKLDGVNLLPYLKEGNTEQPHQALFWRFGPQLAVRKGDWKLVKGPAGGNVKDAATLDGAQLYNLAADIGETTDLSAGHPEKVRELSALWTSWNAELSAPKWYPSGPNRRRQQQSGTAASPGAKPEGPWKSGDVLDGDRSPQVAGRGFTIAARVEVREPKGVILAQGAGTNGYALHFHEGRLALSVRSAKNLTTVIAGTPVPPGGHQVSAEVSAEGAVTLLVDGRAVGGGKVSPLVKQPGEGLSVGDDGDGAVGDYTAPNAVAGAVTGASLTLR